LAGGVISNGGGTSSMESQLGLAYGKREDEYSLSRFVCRSGHP
jgi:hypothetical protein